MNGMNYMPQRKENRMSFRNYDRFAEDAVMFIIGMAYGICLYTLL